MFEINEDDVKNIIDKQLIDEKSKLINIIKESFNHSNKLDVGDLIRVLALWRDG